MGKSGQQAFLTGVTQEDMHIRMIAVAIELHATHGRYFAVAFLEENNFGMGEGYWDLAIEPNGPSISSGYAAPIVGCSQGRQLSHASFSPVQLVGDSADE